MSRPLTSPGGSRLVARELGLRPRETFSLIAEFTTRGSAVEFPVDRDAVTVHPPVPSFGLSAQPLQIGDSPTTQALPREDADFDLRLIEPTAVSGRVMDGEAIPDFCSHFRAEDGGQRFPAMDVGVVHYQVDGLRFRVCHRQRDGNLSELKTRTIRRGEGKVTARLGYVRPTSPGAPGREARRDNEYERIALRRPLVLTENTERGS